MSVRDDFGRVYRWTFGMKGASPAYRSAVRRLLENVARVHHLGDKPAKSPGRPPGVSNLDWGAWPGEVGNYHKRMLKKCPTKAEATRQTCAEFGVEAPTCKRLEKLTKTLGGWATREWTEFDEAAWEARQYEKNNPRPEPTPKSKAAKRRHDPLGAQFSEGSTGGRVTRS